MKYPKKVLWRTKGMRVFEIGFILEEKLGCLCIEDSIYARIKNYWPPDEIEIKGYLPIIEGEDTC